MINRKNWFDVKAYLEYQQNIRLLQDQSIKRKWAHLRHLLDWADSVALPDAHTIQPTYPIYLQTARNDAKSGCLALSSMQRACAEGRNFYLWARKSPDIKSRYQHISIDWIDTFRMPKFANSQDSEESDPTIYMLSEVLSIINLPVRNMTEQRDRAATAFLFASGMRLGAFVTLPIHCVDIASFKVKQAPSLGVHTKNNESATTSLLPIKELISVIREWDHTVRSCLTSDAPWYAALHRTGKKLLQRQNTPNPVSRRQRYADGLLTLCKRAEIEYRSPHSLRHSHAVYALKRARTLGELKAISQNLMHKSLVTTDSIYGRLAHDDVHEIITSLPNSWLINLWKRIKKAIVTFGAS